MEKIVITTDSGCCASNLANNRDFFVVPACVNSSSEVYRDGIDIDNKEIFDRMAKGEVFNTSSPIIENYMEIFNLALSKGESVIHICMSDGISSGSYNASVLVADTIHEELKEKRIYVINSKQAGPGGEMVIRKVQEMIAQDIEVVEIVDYIENKYIPRIKTSFLVPEPSGFIRSGRDKSDLELRDHIKIAGVKLATMMNIKFIVDFIDGDLKQSGRIRVSIKKSLLEFLKRQLETNNRLELIDPDIFVYGTTLTSDEIMMRGNDYLRSLKYFREVVNSPITGVISAYTSENLFGTSYVLKK